MDNGSSLTVRKTPRFEVLARGETYAFFTLEGALQWIRNERLDGRGVCGAVWDKDTNEVVAYCR
jgi:hypothetical protein